jgi:hypothetical protein
MPPAPLRAAVEIAASPDALLGRRAGRVPPALYAREGFDEVSYRRAARGLPGFVALVKPLR